MSTEHLDVLIVGAGLSGIGAAYHLQEALPGKTYALLEAREDLGGTWDLFRYPGIRSDSDMHTLGYRFKPWTAAKSITDGASILSYVRETARENGIEERIRFNRRVVRAEWSSAEARWTVEVERSDSGGSERLTCGFLWVCSGYFRYDEGYTPEFEGVERFAGPVIHPQHWPEDFDYAGKRVVVIGSGATAVTLVPTMAEKAAHVTMLQRSPTYVVSLSSVDSLAVRLRRLLPDRLVYSIVRWKNVLLQMVSFQLSRRFPSAAKRLLRKGVERRLPPGYDVDTHFTPPYNPWDQRLCLVPDGDLFGAIREGRASVLTDEIETFTEKGLRLKSGDELEADAIVTATGLKLLFLGGIQVSVDGEEVDLPSRMTYKAMLIEGVPNLAFVIGYTNASWTLKADLVSEYVCRLLAHMDAHGHTRCVPEVGDPTIAAEPHFDFTSGYVLRSLDQIPKQGSKAPWRLRQNYPLDLRAVRRSPIDDGTLRFAGPPEPSAPASGGDEDADLAAAPSAAG